MTNASPVFIRDRKTGISNQFHVTFIGVSGTPRITEFPFPWPSYVFDDGKPCQPIDVSHETRARISQRSLRLLRLMGERAGKNAARNPGQGRTLPTVLG